MVNGHEDTGPEKTPDQWHGGLDRRQPPVWKCCFSAKVDSIRSENFLGIKEGEPHGEPSFLSKRNDSAAQQERSPPESRCIPEVTNRPQVGAENLQNQSETTMLIACVMLYMMVTVAIGIYASTRVHSSKDFMVAGRSLPLYMNFACVFATWFGAETVLSVSARFAHKGMGFVSGDPFGASVCLILVAFFFARTFYRMELMTIGDYYHLRYGKFVEVITSFGIASSYLGWTSAQLSALGLVINVLFPSITLNQAILIGAGIVTIYTLFGGMWSVALTDVVQTAAIVIGLLIVAYILGNKAGGVEKVFEAASSQGKLNLFPHVTTAAWMAFLGEFITMSLGSIPQQDVFQRVTSAKNERTAFIGTLMGGLFYFAFAFVPMFIAFSATLFDADFISRFEAAGPREVQKILPSLILEQTPIWCQVLFFGAVLSAILSTASGTILAPASLITENVLNQFTRNLSDKTMLWVLRGILILVAIVSTSISVSSDSSMYEMVEGGYKVTLVVAFVPLVCGIYWKRASTQGAIFSILLGVPVWLGTEYIYSEESEQIWRNVPPHLYGLAASFLGMWIGSSMRPWIKHREADPAELAKKRGPAMGH